MNKHKIGKLKLQLRNVRRQLMVNAIGCPDCGAPAGSPCTGVSKKIRKSPHLVRLRAYRNRKE